MKDIERVEDEPLQETDYAREINYYLEEFCETQNPPIEDLREAPQAVFNACMMYIGHHAFKGTRKLMLDRPLEGYESNTKNIGANSSCGAYDIDKVNAICDVYVYLCGVYNKVISILGFSKLSGVSNDTIHDWHKENNKLSNKGRDIYSKLTKEREESIVSRLADSKQAVAHIAMINHYGEGWSNPATGLEDRKRIQTADQLPRFNEQKELNVVEAQDVVDGG